MEVTREILPTALRRAQAAISSGRSSTPPGTGAAFFHRAPLVHRFGGPESFAVRSTICSSVKGGFLERGARPCRAWPGNGFILPTLRPVPSRRSASLIQPGATDTPFPQHARNYMDEEPKLPTPMDVPEHVAEVILEAATSPRRDVKVSTTAKLNTTMAKVAPKLGDRFAARQASRQQYDEPPRHPEGTLYHAGEGGRIRGSGGRME